MPDSSISQSIFICSKCPEIHIKCFSIASRTTRLRPALTAARCPTNKLYYERKGKTQRVQNSLRWRAHTLYQVLSEVNNSY